MKVEKLIEGCLYHVSLAFSCQVVCYSSDWQWGCWTKRDTVLRIIAVCLHVRFLTDVASLGVKDSTASWICTK